MADQSDVEIAMVALAAAALYPYGTAGASACGQPSRIYRGWPNAAALDADLRTNQVNVTVSSIDGTARSTTRFPDHWIAAPLTATLTMTVAGEMVTVAGSADAGQLAGIAVNGASYVYRTIAGDTPSLVAANLAAQARADLVVQLDGATFRLAGASGVIARVVTDAPAFREVRRQVQRFRVSCWCSTPEIRDSVAATIDGALAPIRFMDLSDGTEARLLFAGTVTLDQSQDAGLYRRDLIYDIEYATTVAAIQQQMLFGTGTVDGTQILG